MAVNQGQSQQQITNVQTKTIDEISKQGLEKENAEKIKGNHISFEEDKETSTLLFTGNYQKLPRLNLKHYLKYTR